MIVSRRENVSSELRHKISPAMLMFSGTPGIFLKLMCTGVAAFVLYLVSDRNGFLYLLGATLCSGAVLIWYKFFPLRPYRGVFYDRSMHDIDATDPVVMRLVELYRSKEAYRHLCVEAVKLAGILFVTVWGATILKRYRVAWSFEAPSSLFWGLMLLCFVICFSVLSADHSEWGVMTWARRETAMSAGKGLK